MALILLFWSLTAPAQVRGQTPLTVDTQNRAAVARFYNEVYKASQGVELAWAGDVANCLAGDTSQTYKDATILRVNYYRAMAGLPGDVTLDTNLNYECQQAAMMMSAQDTLSHYPTVDWWCYNAAGADAALHSNLALGTAGPEAVDEYLDDAGVNNTYVGHRRWVLFPPQHVMGTGSVPEISGPDGTVLSPMANALWVVGSSTNRPATPDFVAWPPGGFVPYQILPHLSGRWSLAMPGANFSRTEVSMQCCSTNIPLVLEPLRSGDGDNTIVWRPALPSGSQIGLTYSVSLTNMLVAGQQRSVSYAVSIFDAEEPELVARLTSGNLLLTWPQTAHSYTLQENTSFAPTATWALLGVAPQLTNGLWSVVVGASHSQCYYRLMQW